MVCQGCNREKKVFSPTQDNRPYNSPSHEILGVLRIFPNAGVAISKDNDTHRRNKGSTD